MMATAFKLDDEPTAIVEITPQTALALFTDKEKYSEFYSRIKAETDKFVPDLTTKKGRDAIASEARKVVTAKTTLEKAGKGLVEEWRAKTAVVTSARIEMVNELDALAKEVRRPLTEWEEAEKARVAQAERQIADIEIAAIIAPEDTAATVRARGAMMWSIKLESAIFGDLIEKAETAKKNAVAVLKAALARLEQEEADRAELRRLRAEKEAREEEEARVAAAQEAARKEAEELAAYNKRREAAEKADLERIERAKAEAAATAQREAEKAAQEERDRIQREHEEALAAERAKAAEADRLRQAETARIAEQERQREAQEASARAEEKRIAEEQAKRERNRAHRAQIMGEAKISIMAAGAIDEAAAIAIVKAIVAGSIPHVSLEF